MAKTVCRVVSLVSFFLPVSLLLLGVCWQSQLLANTTVGGGAFLGLAAYSYISGTSQLQQQRQAILKSGSFFGMRSRQAGIAGISLGLAWAGLWRLFK